MSNPQATANANDRSHLIASNSNSDPAQADLGASTSITSSSDAGNGGKKGIAKLIADGTFPTAKRKLGREDIVKKTMGPVHGG